LEECQEYALVVTYFCIEPPNQNSLALPALSGGSKNMNDMYHHKYLKYKQKYSDLKMR